MKSELDVHRELAAIRKLLADSDESDDVGYWPLYMVQQALLWVLGQGMAPSILTEVIKEVAAERARELLGPDG